MTDLPVQRLKTPTKFFAATLLAVPCLLFALATVDASTSRHHLEELLADVNVSDGISEREADGIAWAYFLGYVGACGGPDHGKLVDGEWVMPVSFGYAGRPMDSPIRINAKTGAVSQAGGPSFRSYGSFRFSALWGIPVRSLTYRLEEYYADKWGER
ncbi:hypothetical protein [Duganella sp. Root1480D1]|uniref:hypothetical protein n=1 Tax=Duganella sp. Root1480D1 TaxID=1736471 RepID=UPI0007101EFA|nr:hypothetical protein [Duganella sp. Root1480D1]KQZ45027.1 hypothetical protein ASD58_01890 [Duganella sp. Root1480D1]